MRLNLDFERLSIIGTAPYPPPRHAFPRAENRFRDRVRRLRAAHCADIFVLAARSSLRGAIATKQSINDLAAIAGGPGLLRFARNDKHSRSRGEFLIRARGLRHGKNERPPQQIKKGGGAPTGAYPTSRATLSDVAT
jgi:hypothetical protein